MMRRHGRSGFSLLEMVISSAILTILGLTVTLAMRNMTNLAHTSSARARVQRNGGEALTMVLADLRRSGFVEVDGRDYPHLFEDGDAELPFELHAHDVAESVAEDSDYDFGVNREIVLVAPLDGNGDGQPDVDGAGQLVWDTQEISYVLRTNGDGRNVVERRLDGVNPEIVAWDVERLVFDNAESSGWVVPLSAIRVQIFFRTQDDRGQEIKYFVEGTARLRNGQE
ncbi:MAG: prepilin-type N-terminal cleavage/methylation domain-containing protein [Planctomycetota bacterium]